MGLGLFFALLVGYSHVNYTSLIFPDGFLESIVFNIGNVLKIKYIFKGFVKLYAN